MREPKKKGLSKLARFFIVCAAVVCVGLVVAIAGFATGGIRGVDKVAENKDWLGGSPGDVKLEAKPGLEFDSVEVTGDVDVKVVGKDSAAKGTEELADMAGDSKVVSEVIKGSGVYTLCGENIPEPEISTQNGTLYIKGSDYNRKIEINLTAKDTTPQVLVLCPEAGLKSLKINNEISDIAVMGTTIENCEITCSDGDIDFEGVVCKGLKLKGRNADADLAGAFYGKTEIDISDGDVDFETSVKETEYETVLKTADGDISVNESIEIEDSPYEYIKGNGPNKLYVNVKFGDIDAFFGKLVDRHDDSHRDFDDHDDHKDHDDD